MVYFNRFGLTPLALSGTGLGTVLKTAEDVAAQMAGQLATTIAPGVMAGYGEFTRATVRATDEGAVLEVIAPGFGPDDLEISIKRNEVAVRGERGGDDGQPKHRFSRTWRLGFPIDVDTANATAENGVLSIELPRHASEQPRSLTVQGERRSVDAKIEADEDPKADE